MSPRAGSGASWADPGGRTGGSGVAGGELRDVELVRRFMTGDGDAFSLLMKRHERRVYNLAYRLLGRQEDARDATQEAFLACYRRIATFRQDAAFTTWLHRIAVNACYDILRKRGPELPHPEDLAEGSPVSDHSDRAAAAVDVQRALLAVPMEFRAVLVLHDVQGFPYDDVAEALSIPLGTVKSRLHRGRVALARALSPEPRAAPAPSNPESV